MPSKGDPLTQEQQQLLHDWILEGADFGSWKGNEAAPLVNNTQPSTPAEPHPLDKLAIGIRSVPPAQYSRFPKAHIVPVSISNALLRVSFVSEPSAVTDLDVAKLQVLQDHITDLDISRTRISDKGLKAISTFNNLTKLDLHETEIGDQGLAHLRSLPHLRSLNLHSTRVSNKGLQALASLKGLKRLYLWNTRVTEYGYEELLIALPNTEISFLADMPYPEVVPTNAPMSTKRDPRKKRKT